MSEFINLTDIALRVREIHEQSGFNAAEFCKETDLSSSTYSQIISGKQKINIDTINKVVLRWGNTYNPMWILFGTQPMDHSTDESNKNFGLSDTPPPLESMSAELVRQAEEIGRLKEALINNKPKEIDRITIFYTDNSFANYKLDK